MLGRHSTAGQGGASSGSHCLAHASMLGQHAWAGWGEQGGSRTRRATLVSCAQSAEPARGPVRRLRAALTASNTSL